MRDEMRGEKTVREKEGRDERDMRGERDERNERDEGRRREEGRGRVILEKGGAMRVSKFFVKIKGGKVY